MTTKHPDYAILAARIAVSNLHKETKKIFTGENTYPCFHDLNLLPPSLPLSLSLSSPLVVMKDLHEYRNPHNDKHSPMVSKELLDIVTEHADVCRLISSNHSFYLSLSLSLQRLNSAIIYDRDFGYNYFGFKVYTLCMYIIILCVLRTAVP